MKKKIIFAIIFSILLSCNVFADAHDYYMATYYPHLNSYEWRAAQIVNGEALIAFHPNVKPNMVGYIANRGTDYAPDYYVYDINNNLSIWGSVLMDIDNDLQLEAVCSDRYGKILSNYSDINIGTTNYIGCLLDDYGNVMKFGKLRKAGEY